MVDQHHITLATRMHLVIRGCTIDHEGGLIEGVRSEVITRYSSHFDISTFSQAFA
jgi:hypothetical protein